MVTRTNTSRLIVLHHRRFSRLICRGLGVLNVVSRFLSRLLCRLSCGVALRRRSRLSLLSRLSSRLGLCGRLSSGLGLCNRLSGGVSNRGLSRYGSGDGLNCCLRGGGGFYSSCCSIFVSRLSVVRKRGQGQHSQAHQQRHKQRQSPLGHFFHFFHLNYPFFACCRMQRFRRPGWHGAGVPVL